MAFRPLEALEIALPDHGLTLQPDLSMIGRRKCRVVTGRFRSGAVYRLWIDPAAEFSAVRLIVSLNGRDLQQFDIDHEQHQGAGWTPSSWKVMVMNSSDEYPGQAEVFQSVHVRVAKTEINSSIPQERFDLKFPPGTLVADRIAGKEFVSSDNRLGRPLSPEETRMLAGKLEPEMIVSTDFPYRTTLIAVGLAAALGLLFYLRWKRATAGTVHHRKEASA
jgi:hypothetical protein